MFLSVSCEQVLELFIIQHIVCFTVNVKVGFNQDVFTNEILSLISVTYELCIVITTPMSSNRFPWWGLMNFHNIEMCSTPNYIVTLPRYFSFRLSHLNISTGPPSDKLDEYSQRMWLIKNFSQ
jgi:hypothetical protein